MTARAIGISGGSCSGKSTLTRKIFDRLGPDQCVILPQDDYFFGIGDAPEGKGGPNFDHPNAVDFEQMCLQLAQLKNGQTIDRPLYDFPTHMPKTETERTESRPVILIDGILILQHQPLRDLLDLSIFVECDAETRFARRLERDVRERGRTAQSVNDQFANQVGPMHDLHVEPSKTHADIVINSQQCEMSFSTLLASIDSLLSH
ncbi:uridine kinase [Parasphingorhabdus flavimaris]|uniref:uridine/cytidine kinase n=1 Tax=Parasphingorhabdus flavimaris TaxID=266812 RepID=A0ABX2N5S8_9SPHN|nr:uridine kinase [Parasphingorhabdus flavimaris]NVD28948.1 uridine kinase [Parasphingorhabdus flavimaris]|tara:strand:+ start:4603 stop:5214 length:612 start_codon:yes stop_codon:yes gene_type:complete